MQNACVVRRDGNECEKESLFLHENGKTHDAGIHYVSDCNLRIYMLFYEKT